MEKLILCRREGENLVLDYENLNKIGKIPNFDPELPVALISVIGEPESGKTTFTNLVIQNLKHNGGSGWLDRIDLNSTPRNKVDELPGFPIWSEATDSIEDDKSEISLWPEAFCIKRHGNKFNVLLLHVNYSIHDQRHPGKDSLEFLLALLSSRIIEVHWKQDEFRYLHIYQHLGKEKYLDYACSSVVYLLRKNNERIKAVDQDAKEWLETRFSNKKIGSLVSKIKYLGITNVPDTAKLLQTPNLSNRGYLKLENDVYNDIYDSISLIVDDEQVFPKHISKDGKLLVQSTLHQHFNHCLDIVGKLFGFKTDTLLPNKENTNDGFDTVNITQEVVPPGAQVRLLPPSPIPPPQPVSPIPPPPPVFPIPPPQPVSPIPPPQPVSPTPVSPPPPPESPPPPLPTSQPPTLPSEPPALPTFELPLLPASQAPPPPISSSKISFTSNQNITASTSTNTSVPNVDPKNTSNGTAGSLDNGDFLNGLKNGRSRLKKPPVPPKSDNVIAMTAGKSTDLLNALQNRFKAIQSNNDASKNNGSDNEEW